MKSLLFFRSSLLFAFCTVGSLSPITQSAKLLPVNNIEKFHLPDLITQQFPLCDLYFTDDKSNSSAEFITEILVDPTFHSNQVNQVASYVLHLATYFPEHGWNRTKCSHISCFPLAPRKASHCSVAIGIFMEGNEYLPHFNELLFSPYAAPLRNERDHAIFLTGPKINLDQFLQDKSLAVVKHKLGVQLESVVAADGHILGKTNCFFCDNGQYKILDVNVTFDKSVNELFPDFTRNGYGRVLRASGPTKYPFLYELEHVGNDKWKSKRGVYHFALQALLPHFNFSFSVYPSRNGGSGTHFPNGTWDGVIGDMVYDLADFGTAASANPERYIIVSFTNFPISYIYVTFMMGPPRITYTWRAIYWPFALSLWALLLFCIFLVVFVFKIMDKATSRVQGQSIYRHLFENISFAFIGQGYDCADPETHSARFLIIVWLFATLILNTLYVSQVVGLLAFPLYQEQPLTFKSLTESVFKWGFDQSGGSLFAHFKLSNNPIFHTIFENRLPEQSAIDCFNMAMKTDFACITWSGVADYTAYKNLTLKHGKSPLVFAYEKTQFIPSGIMLPRRSLFKDNFNSILGMLTDSGQDAKWLSMDYENLRKAKVDWQHSLGMKGDDDGEDEEDMLSLSNLLGIFYIYIIGHVLSLLLFVWEKVKWRRDLLRMGVTSEIKSLSLEKYKKGKACCNIPGWKFLETVICGVSPDCSETEKQVVVTEEVDDKDKGKNKFEMPLELNNISVRQIQPSEPSTTQTYQYHVWDVAAMAKQEVGIKIANEQKNLGLPELVRSKSNVLFPQLPTINT